VQLSSDINDAINALVNAEPYGAAEVTEMDELSVDNNLSPAGPRSSLNKVVILSATG
jgi:hypothetical protein